MIRQWDTPIAQEVIDRAFLGVTLPSEESAQSVVEGKPGGIATLVLHYIGRSAIIGSGLALAGARGKNLVKFAAAAAGAIEVVILLEAWLHKSQLPTGDNATDVVRGEPGAIPKMAYYFVARSVIIGIALALAGARGTNLVKLSLAGSAAVQAFVLGYAAFDERK